MQLTWRFILKNVVPIISAIIGVSGLIFVNMYFKPDVRYEVGSYYRSGDRAITSLKLQNYGHGDAEEIRVSMSFPDTILDVRTSDEALPLTITSGGTGSKSVAGSIQRLVADEVVYIYVAVRNPDGRIPADYERFVTSKGIVYKGGIAQEGRPFPWLPVGAAVLPFVILATWMSVDLWKSRMWLKAREESSKLI